MATIEMPNGFRITTYEIPPDGFDPLSAPTNVLQRHGFPLFPNPQEAPEQYARWQRIFSRPTTYVIPTFRQNPERKHGKRLPSPLTAGATSTNWSGSVVLPPAGGSTFQSIEGQWTVPDPFAPTPNGTWFYAAEWIGIDGDGSNDVFQAGTGTDVEIVGGTTQRNCYAWWEWFPENEVAITNVPVSPGDVVMCILTVQSQTSGSVYIMNLSNTISTTFTIHAPNGTVLQGNCAEWIVERPEVNGALASLADFSVVYMDEGTATCAPSANGGTPISTDLGAGTLLTMIGNNNTPLSIPTIENSTLMKFTWKQAN